ncbi:NAD(P)/FAD-dependent oxidoreductase [Natrialbaceae archaeon A-CW2]
MVTDPTGVQRVVVIGGGTGGTVVLNKLSTALEDGLADGNIELTLVTDTLEHVYKPLFLYVAFNRKKVANSRRPHQELLDRQVEVRLEHVSDIDTDSKRLTFESGSEPLRYDYLVIAIGARLVPETIDGLEDSAHHFYSATAAEALRDELATFTSGHLVSSTAGMPHMCPAAPIEFVLIADEWFRDRGYRDDIEITYTYPLEDVHGKQAIADWVRPLFEERDIAVETSFEVESAESDEKQLVAGNGRTLNYDLLVTIPPHAGGPLVERAELGHQWIEVDKHTLEATHADHVYALGDITDVPTSKAGSAAHYQAGVVAERIRSEVHGQPPTATYDGKTLCFVETGLEKATFVSFGYDEEPVVRPPSQFVHLAKLAYNESYWLTARGLL